MEFSQLNDAQRRVLAERAVAARGAGSVEMMLKALNENELFASAVMRTHGKDLKDGQ